MGMLGHRGTVGLVTALAITGLVTGCSGGDSGDDGGGGGGGGATTTVTSSSTPAETTTTTVTASPSSPASESSESESQSSPPETSTPETTSSPPPSTSEAAADLPGNTRDYGDAFVRAWGIGDKPDASRYATDEAVDGLFARDSRGGSQWAHQDSLTQGDRTQLRYADGSGQSLYILIDTATADSGSPDAVVGASFEWDDLPEWSEDDWYVEPPEDTERDDSDVTGLPSSVGEYCDSLVRAWGTGDRGAGEVYATEDVMSTLYDEYGAGGSDWQRTSTTSSSATYQNSDGDTLTLHVDATTVSSGRGDGVTSAEF